MVCCIRRVRYVHVHSTHTKTSFDLSFQTVDGKDLYKYKCVLVSWSVGRSAVVVCRVPPTKQVFFPFSSFFYKSFWNGRSIVTVHSVHLSIVKAYVLATVCNIQYPIPTHTHSVIRSLARSLAFSTYNMFINVIRSIVLYILCVFSVVRFSSFFLPLSLFRYYTYTFDRMWCTCSDLYVRYAPLLAIVVVVVVTAAATAARAVGIHTPYVYSCLQLLCFLLFSRPRRGRHRRCGSWGSVRAGWKLLLSAKAVAAVSRIQDSLFCLSLFPWRSDRRTECVCVCMHMSRDRGTLVCVHRHKYIHHIANRRTKFNYTFRFPFTHTHTPTV